MTVCIRPCKEAGNISALGGQVKRQTKSGAWCYAGRRFCRNTLYYFRYNENQKNKKSLSIS